MSTWTSKLALTAVAALAACDGFEPVTRTAPSAVMVPGDIVVTGPVGYCIDEGATRLGAGEAFVLLGSCAAITRDGAQPTPSDPTIMAVSVRSGVDVSLDELALLFSLEGAHVPGAEASAVLETDLEPDALFLRTNEGRAETWRALLPVSGTLISARVLYPPEEPTAPEVARAALDALAQALVAANTG